MEEYRERYQRWTEMELEDPALTRELAAIAEEEEAIRDRFGLDLKFGTAGLRGVLGAGTNRMNLYTVRRATQGLANVLNAKYTAPSAAIAYDSRINSQLFARETARVFAANGIKTWIYRELMPTPALSFAVRELGCQAGVNITASHNPAQYNGYKVYDETGCQIGTETADAVLGEIEATDLFHGVRLVPFEEGLAAGQIQWIDDMVVERYLEEVLACQEQPDICRGAGLRLVYSPLNGAGRRCVLEMLRRIGVTEVTVVPQQEWPDGNFPTCLSPNPENREAMAPGLALAAEKEAHLLLATDPDSDRVGVAVRHKGAYPLLTGNEVGVLLTDYIGSCRKEQGRLPAGALVVKSIVTTTMTIPVAEQYGVEVVDVLTGFKYIGEKIAQLEQAGEAERFLLGFEESCGYLTGSYVRDKDAVNGAMLLVEMAAHWLVRGKTLVDRLEELYAQFGTYYNTVDSFAFEGVDGMARMAQLLTDLRAQGFSQLGGEEVAGTLDYQNSSTGLPAADVLQYTLQGGSTVVVRPSGTEPKLKVYFMIRGQDMDHCKACKERVAADVRDRLGL